MKTVIVLTVVVAVLHAKSYKMETRSTGSLIARLIKANLYQKYLEQQHLYRTAILQKGSQPMVDFFDEIYTGNITFGTPGQTVSLMMDTSSSNIWVVDSTCNTKACNGSLGSAYNKHKFNMKESSTLKTNTSLYIIGGSGWLEGPLAWDYVSFAGLTIENQGFISATGIAQAYGYLPIDGVFGLAWPALAQGRVTPPMENIFLTLDDPLFTIWLDKKHNMSFVGSNGLITYGAIDTTNCLSDITYATLTSESYWQFNVDGFSFANFTYMETNEAYSDTSTSLIGVQPYIRDTLANMTGATFNYDYQLYTVDCSTIKTLPDLQFIISGVKHNVSSEDYVLDLEIGDGKCALGFFAFGSAGFGPSWIFGHPFMRSFCSIYDIGQSRIGFAKAIHSGI